ncbi:MAG: ribonuclease domain-containing protein [Acutalibacteraceae bacterium]|jgi:ribonuclease T1
MKRIVRIKRLAAWLLAAALLIGCAACGSPPRQTDAPAGTVITAAPTASAPKAPDEDGVYTHRDDVAAYLVAYGRLPGNFITKKEARQLGWNGGSLEEYAPGKCIGGDRFGNYEGRLPEDADYRECDIDTLGASSRGAKRLVYSEDAIYYTEDHYETFVLLYGEETP